MNRIISYFKTIAFQKRIEAYFLVAICIICTIFLLVYKSNNYFIQSAKWVEHEDEVRLKNLQILFIAQDLENIARGYLLSGDKVLEIKFNNAVSLLPGAISELKSITSDNVLAQQRIVAADRTIQQNISFREALINTRRQQGFEAANKLFKTGIGIRLMDKLRQVLSQIDNEEKRLLNQRKKTLEKSITRVSRMINLLVAVILTTSMLGFVAINKNITRRNIAENKLKTNNYLIGGIINNSHNPISIRNTSGKFIRVNEAFATLVNQPAGFTREILL